jgi:4-amino-4-deoxy-L-arabinose transferase-like glycosyltransferase
VKYWSLVRLSDLRFWIFVAFLLRLPSITQAPLEFSHAWRQALSNMSSRYYAEATNFDVLRPRTNIIDKKSNIIASEFPAFNLVHAGISKVFGYRHWYGRLINLLMSSLGIWCFYLFLLRFLKDEQAKTAAILLLSSIFFSFGRKLMPDVWSVSLVLTGMYLITEWIVRMNGAWWRLFGGMLAISLGVLSKLPALLTLSFLILPLYVYRHLVKKWILIAGLLILFLFPAWWWYFEWTPQLVQEGAFQLFFPYSFREGLSALLPLWQSALEKIYFSAMQSFAGFAFFLTGMYVLFVKREDLFLGMVFISLLLLIAFAIKTGEVFPTHNYYVIPFVPVMCMVAAIGVYLIRGQTWQMAMIALIVSEGLLNQAYDFVIPEERKIVMQANEVLKQIVPTGDTIAVYSEGSPVLAYFAAYPCVRAGKKEMQGAPMLHQEHIQYWLALRSEINEREMTFPEVYRDDNFVLYKIRNEK